ncbi:ABC transporter permease/M1 family aminopeptidase [Flavihumibacter petaseus]|uniref:Peptidase M1 family protein n=1 Tax=Flavihumibacter petaseus NBRC 106054 TaxID=1220578 RepID=A0A0E9MV94_9BACT|nr:M1 family aminopeptidase [Flavihumibacter petaseus]GAO41677.1 peptidase M1 family protein [Flavihumibacter petaseus NBRC 106054]
MFSVLSFDLAGYRRSPLFYGTMLLLLLGGLFTGSNFNLSIGEGVLLNGPYIIGFMIGLLSLIIIFIATLFAVQLLFREWDSRFDQLLFTMPLKATGYVSGRFLALLLITFTGFLLLTVGFAIGQSQRSGGAENVFNLLYYAWPILVFGLINSFFVCAVLSVIGWRTGNKLLVSIGGLLLYVLYMIGLLYSNSPFMAQSLPQTTAAQQVAAMIDPFGLSAYFWIAKDFSVQQRNTRLIPFSGLFAYNRTGVFIVSCAMLWWAQGAIRRKPSGNRRHNIPDPGSNSVTAVPQAAVFEQPARLTISFNYRTTSNAIMSVARMDLIALVKSIALPAALLLTLFMTGMEMYADIEKGIRIPQQFASSGLMARSIIRNFHFPAALLLVYFINDVFWKSDATRFNQVGDTFPMAHCRIAGHFVSGALLIFFLCVANIVLGIFFQAGFSYTIFDWRAYTGVGIFVAFPLLLLLAILLLVNAVSPGRYVALAFSFILVAMLVSPLQRKLLPVPLLGVMATFNGPYSDFSGYGPYLAYGLQRLAVGASVIAIITIIAIWVRQRCNLVIMLLSIGGLAVAGYFFGRLAMHEYVPADRNREVREAVSYEKSFRQYAGVAMPAITSVRTRVTLFPAENCYKASGTYTLKNTSQFPVTSLLINSVNEGVRSNVTFVKDDERTVVSNDAAVLALKHPLRPGDSAHLQFELSSRWSPANGHQSFNAIVENGTFLRISRYFPSIGYQADRELEDSAQRRQMGLGGPTPLKKLSDTTAILPEGLLLDMEIITDRDQVAVAVGELVEQKQLEGRSYYRYRTGQPIPFRFALSSGRYGKKTLQHNGTAISIYYHPLHETNVDHLLNNAASTLDYCQEQFGAYPFRTVTFAEVSSFTRGFAGTAYPGTIYMTENMIFHANIHADRQQDVINELAGHELSHLWWGNNQISPDDREGAQMLTESLAMYTEMMLYKKMYGRSRMLERVQLHRQIYESERGFIPERPLYRVTGSDAHIYYSKGAVVLVTLSDIIGESKLNLALRNFLHKHRYPFSRPVSTDLISAILDVTPPAAHQKVTDLFTQTGLR